MPRKFLFCECHGNQVMAIDKGDVIEVKARHHGLDHFLTIPTDGVKVKGIDFNEHLDEVVASSSN